MVKYQNPRLRVVALADASSAALEFPSEQYDRLLTNRSRKDSSKPLAPQPEVWGRFNNYRSAGLKRSAAVHAVLLALILWVSFRPPAVPIVTPQEHVTLIAPSPDSYTLHTSKTEVHGGGGGGDRTPIPAPRGRLPKLAMQQVTPPQIVVPMENPKLPVEPAVVVPPQVRIAENTMPNLGTLTATPMPKAPPSNGPGTGAGIGAGSGGGVGAGHGAGVGIGSGGGIGGGIFKVGGGISAPKALATPDPEYTEEARNAKTQGTCVLWMIVDQQGHPKDIKVIRGLGFGLDARAIEAVKQWRFQPAMKDGQPVNVQINVEVAFRLY